jgi:DNA-binding response OmpR family regulator
MTSDQPLSARRILAVEDQYYLATDICEWLEAAGAVVIGPAPDAAQACDLIDRQQIDTAVVDINLGRGPTYEVAKELSERRVPFLFATGYDETAIPTEFEQTARLEKPFNGPALVAAVSKLDSPST